MFIGRYKVNQQYNLNFFAFEWIGLTEKYIYIYFYPCGSAGKASAHNVGDPGSLPGSGRSPGEGNGNPLQYSCLENSMEGVAWQATVHGVPKSQTQLNDFTFYHVIQIHLTLLGSMHETGCSGLVHWDDPEGWGGEGGGRGLQDGEHMYTHG